jgi:hypothetical protein
MPIIFVLFVANLNLRHQSGDCFLSKRESQSRRLQ